MIEGRELFRFCACCPNPCRRAVPAERPLQLESETPSALSMIALAVIDGALDYDAATRDALARTEAAHLCRPACPYGFDVAGAIDAFTAERDATAAPPAPPPADGSFPIGAIARGARFNE